MYSTPYARVDMVISNPMLGLNGKIHTLLATKKRPFRAALNTHFEMEVTPPGLTRIGTNLNRIKNNIRYAKSKTYS